jgi:drug/metabolite transporter (DMT)-like permease
MSEKFKRYIPLIFAFLWGTGFIGAKYLLPHVAPFTILAIRFTIASITLVIIALCLKAPMKMSRTQLKQGAYISLFLHFCYTGGIFFAVAHGVSAGVTAVVVSLQPVLVALIAIPVLGEKLRGSQLVGLSMGLIGVVLLLSPKIFSGEVAPAYSAIGIVAAVASLIGSVWGTIEQKRLGSDFPLLAGMAFQFAVTAALLWVLAFTTESVHVEWSLQVVLALAWVTFVLSIGSIMMLFYMLRQGSATTVSSLLYLGTPMTAIEAYFLFGEHIPPVGLIGMAIAVTGVWLVLRQSNASKALTNPVVN